MMNQLVLLSTVILVTLSCSGKPNTDHSSELSNTSTDIDSIGLNLQPEGTGTHIATNNDIWTLIDEKAEWFKKGVNSDTNLNNIPDGFLNFYEKFISDSMYQVTHVHFKSLIGVIGECDTTLILKSNNWRYTDWNFIKFFPVDNFTSSLDGWENRFYSSSDKFYFEFKLKEVGLIYQTGFELINDKWVLTLYYVNAC